MGDSDEFGLVECPNNHYYHHSLGRCNVCSESESDVRNPQEVPTPERVQRTPQQFTEFGVQLKKCNNGHLFHWRWGHCFECSGPDEESKANEIIPTKPGEFHEMSNEEDRREEFLIQQFWSVRDYRRRIQEMDAERMREVFSLGADPGYETHCSFRYGCPNYLSRARPIILAPRVPGMVNLGPAPGPAPEPSQGNVETENQDIKKL